MHEVLVDKLGGLSLPRKSVVRLTDRPDMTLDVYRGRKTTMQQHAHSLALSVSCSPGLNETLLKSTVKILKFGTPQTIAIIVLKLVKFDVTLH